MQEGKKNKTKWIYTYIYNEQLSPAVDHITEKYAKSIVRNFEFLMDGGLSFSEFSFRSKIILRRI